MNKTVATTATIDDDDDFILAVFFHANLLVSSLLEKKAATLSFQSLHYSDPNAKWSCYLTGSRAMNRNQHQNRRRPIKIGFVELGTGGFHDVNNPDVCIEYGQYCTNGYETLFSVGKHGQVELCAADVSGRYLWTKTLLLFSSFICITGMNRSMSDHRTTVDTNKSELRCYRYGTVR